MKIGIYQVCFDDHSAQYIEPEFIRYFNKRKDQFYENAIIADLVLSGRHLLWDFCGVLSWRFKSKTLLSGKEVIKAVNENAGFDVINFFPSDYRHEQHPFNRKRFPPATQMAKELDKRRFFEFNLYDYKTDGLMIWCNYWVARPEVMQLYVDKYLLPVIEYFNAPDPELEEFINTKVNHRPGIDYTLIPFFLEGLFSVFCHREKLKVKTVCKL